MSAAEQLAELCAGSAAKETSALSEQQAAVGMRERAVAQRELANRQRESALAKREADCQSGHTSVHTPLEAVYEWRSTTGRP